MLNARLAALAAVLIWISTLVPQTIFAQDADALPPGVRSVDVDGQPIDAATAPVTNNPTPEIGGRVDLEVPAIELIIGDDGAIRVTAELDDRGRFRTVVPQALEDGQYSLSIGELPIGTFTVDSAAQVAADTSQQRDREPFLDIARVVPYPVDFGDFAPGIGFLGGQYFTLQEEAARTAAADGEATAQDIRETQRSLAEAGWLQRYENRLAVPSTDNPETFDLQVSSFVVEYASGDHASTAFAALAGADSGVEFPVVGNESALTRLSGVTPDTGSEYQAARLVFRVGPMLGMIVYADLLNQEPDLALLDTVAQSVAGRAAVVADRDTVPLGAMTLRLDPSAAVDALVRRDIYDVRAGTLTALYAEDDATRDGRVELLTGTTDAFSSTTNGMFASGDTNRSDRDSESAAQAELSPTSVIAIEGEPTESNIISTPQAIESASEGEEEEQNSVQVFSTSALYGFPGDAEAQAWLNGNQERLAAGAASGDESLIEVPEGPTLGDESITFQTRRAIGAGEQTANGFRIYSRVGAIIAALEISSTGDLPLNDVAKLMALQVDCIEAGGCRGLASLSGRLVEFEVVETAPPVVAEPTKVPRQRPAEPTKVPRQRPTEAPVEQEAPAPIVEPPPAPIEEPPPLPVEEPTQVPVEEPTQVPVEEPTVPPVEEPPPVDEGTPPAGEEPTPAPGEEPTPVPGEEPTPPPDVEPTPTAAVEPTPEPVEEPTAVPDEEPTVAPAEEPTVAPAEEPAAEPTAEPASDESGSDRENDGKSDRERARDRLRDRLD
ncbi:MAG: hypothetical protein K0Q89_896 [Thermomicrobiales bacterium]|nr:hypothetical protein [Thermomicrobiales bacterium]